ncbi:hydroxyisourate hydrolase [Winslowiella iniecta]|uniref:5-hydroxyisourate hydrolase n=1 Tax=Winslowiella iniecta TaxID=1560201 RepID=A0A0L7SWE3_9GAMM|nr:hydroxyisourate hydrolase [Winslowiella iniecta]KOC87474.1 hydroxyisourate hydrolase [Winslowiella iniecta]KOC88701.1 hydroxyisourate hydrolase [Winslowiella iniecta]
MKLLPAVVLASATLSSLAAVAADAPAAKNPLSVHVLNLQTGVPTAGVNVELEQKQQDKWVKLASGTTDQNGRISALYPAGKTFAEGDYKVVFKTGEYYQKVKQETFFPEIPVIFHVAKTDQHYHIPLLLSQYGYSTYRGN